MNNLCNVEKKKLKNYSLITDSNKNLTDSFKIYLIFDENMISLLRVYMVCASNKLINYIYQYTYTNFRSKLYLLYLLYSNVIRENTSLKSS